MQIGKQIHFHRKQLGLTQEELAGLVGVSFQTISSWEKDEYLPQVEKLEVIADALEITVADLCSDTHYEGPLLHKKDRMFSEENMYHFVERAVLAEGLTQTGEALPYAAACHSGQLRKGKGQIPYISHPLLVTCHALALGFREDSLLAAMLLHDVCEDCTDRNGKPILPEMLPVSKEAQEAVRLVTKPAVKEGDWQRSYYQAIAGSRMATIIKVLDRCHNISEMATSFSREKMAEYIIETEEYVFPLLAQMKTAYDDTCYRAAFLIKYQMLSVLESLKRML